MSDRIRAIVALGNPGADHARDRHNAGFWFADRLAERWRVSFASEKKFKGDLARAGRGDDTVWLLKPTTYMNASGEAIQPLAAFHKIAPTEVLVVHDELDLDSGVARLKDGGGHGGHNGLRDTHRVIGATYRRLRIGIGHPGNASRVLSHVLGAPSPDEAIAIDNAIDAAIDAVEVVLRDGWMKGAQKLNSRRD
ncbi:aminoacyl-tRNA hydrolase [Salinisphaera sp. Q1T1-3]|uniref:aminoacyl-tRNA hydrolase n=1 Tax=Salinisphaera sp. Q1T1-3 TaxID=2321229 RepID=UPI000E7630A3|nr:aminoacyl-tRNA hydrolase [Salinisphaera sp. Q1T1-3]RJS94435.1 aminoacyl-tRNA hydrolase [Salinisphaera sp. Q1T1-3]